MKLDSRRKKVFSSTITVLNAVPDVENPKKYIWKSKILGNVMWRDEIMKTIIDKKVVVSQSHSVTILKDKYYSSYLPPKDFYKSDDVSAWTLNANNNLDIILLGVLGNYIKYYTSDEITQLLKEYDKIGIIQAVQDNTNVPKLKHWRVELVK